MTIGVSIRVGLKGVDPVINTAYLTLTDKMGYSGRLLALNRLESWEFTVECPDAASTLERLRRMLATQTTFFNRSKHNYNVHYRWNGASAAEGLVMSALESLAGQIQRWERLGRAGDLDSQRSAGGVILNRAPRYRAEVLVEDIDEIARTALSTMLESELGVNPVTVTELGVRWYLVLRAGSEKEARYTTDEIVVAETRDRGILLNPNYQRYTLLSLTPMEAGVA
jgi:hypothetical protein